MSYPLKLDIDHPDTVWMSKQHRIEIGAYPNIVGQNATLRKAVLIGVHSGPHTDRVAINVGGIKYLGVLSTNNYTVLNVYSYYGSSNSDDDQEAFAREALRKAQYSITYGRLKDKLEYADTRKGNFDDYYLLKADTFDPIDRRTKKRNGDNVVELRKYRDFPPLSDTYIMDRIDELMDNYDKILKYTMDYKTAVKDEFDILETKIRQLTKASRQLVDEIKAEVEDDDGDKDQSRPI